MSLLGPGCERATAIQLVVQGQVRVPDEVRTLEFRVASDRGESFQGSYDLDRPFPHTLTLLPRDRAAAIDATVVARDATGEPVVTRVVRTRFEPGQDLDVFLCLERTCMRMDCPMGTVCRNGTCAEPPSDDGAFDASCVPPMGRCADDADCDDRFFCNGAERCSAGECVAGMPPRCDDGIACTRDECDEATDACVHRPNDAECADGRACNGAERCEPASGCVAGAAIGCDDGDACTMDRCTEPAGSCLHARLDADGDGRPALACGGDDCDDANPLVRPGTMEGCNDVDDDCNGFVDDGIYSGRMPTPLTGAAATPSAVAITHDGDAYAVAWSEIAGGPSRVRLARVAVDGTLVLTPRTHGDPTMANDAPAIAWSGASYGLVWREAARRIRFQAVRRSAGDALGPPVVFDETDPAGPRVVWDGARFALAWGGPSLRFATITPAGAPAGPFTIATAAARIERFAIAQASTGIAVAWVQADSARFAVVAADGTFVTRPTPVALGMASVMDVDLAQGETETALAYQDASTSFDAIRFARLAPSGALVGTPITLSSLGRSTRMRAVQRAGEWGALWLRDVGGTRDLIMRRVRGDGAAFPGDIRAASAVPATGVGVVAQGAGAMGVAWIGESDGNPAVLFAAVACVP